LCCKQYSIAEVKVSLEYVNAAFHIDLAEIIQDINAHSRSELINQINERQEQIIMQLCGPKYSRKHSFKFKRAGSYTKKVTTLLGTISFKVQKVRNRIDNSIASPILEYLDLKRRKYSKDLRVALAEYASKMSYRDASLEFETATGIHVPKKNHTPLRTGNSTKASTSKQRSKSSCRRDGNVDGRRYRSPSSTQQGDEHGSRPHIRRWRAPSP